MEKTNDGGPAFPRAMGERHEAEEYAFAISPAQEGMTLRDYFAAKAMQGLASDHEAAPDTRDITAHYLALRSYQIADAMLKARGE